MELETESNDVNKAGVTQEGVAINNKARLMYYLDTVCSLLTLDEDSEIKRLRLYQEYSLSEYQTRRLLALCYLFKPSVLLDKCIFHSEALCEKEANKFFDIRETFSGQELEHLKVKDNNMAVFGRTEVGLRDVSHTVTVPGNNRAKLMYYLHCVSHLIDLNDDPHINRLRRYDQYYLTGDEVDSLIGLCILLGPEELLNKCIFHNESLCGTDRNKFFDLSVAQTHLAAAGSILIGGQRREVHRIMVFKLGWVRYYWGEPLKTLMAERTAQRRREEIQRNQELQRQRQLQWEHNQATQSCVCTIL